MELLRIVGPSGSGKSLLITMLVEALRSRGHRIATVTRRADAITVISLSTGSRVTLEQHAGFSALRSIVGAIDPAVDLVLAEGFEDPGAPAIEVRPHGAAPATVDARDLVAVVASDELAAAFAQSGPGDVFGLADRIEQVLFGIEPPLAPEEPEPRPRRGFLSRLRRARD